MPDFEFNPNELQQLNRLVFAAGRVSIDSTGGAHRTRRGGQGTDFLDFRPYTPGDDFRRVDWTLFGRMRQLFVRLYEDPRQLCLTLLVDVSRSMAFGSPLTKLQQAQRIACALGFVALQSGDRVFAMTFSEGLVDSVGPLTSPRSLSRLVKFLARSEMGRKSDLPVVARQLRSRRGHRGLIVVLSDFLNAGDCQEAVSALVAGGGKVLAVQVLDPVDRGVGLEGMLRLRDSESDRMVDVKITRATRAEYQAEFERRREQLESLCHRLGQHYMLASTADSYLELVSQSLRSKAVLR